jgi:hypothetical protein
VFGNVGVELDRYCVSAAPRLFHHLAELSKIVVLEFRLTS